MAHETIREVKKQDVLRALMIGFSLKEVATQLDISYHSVCHIANGPGFMDELKTYGKDIYDRVDKELMNSKNQLMSRLTEASSSALDKIISLMSSADERVSLAAAKDILDREGSAIKKSQSFTEQTRKFITSDDLRHIARAATEAEAYENSASPVPLQGNKPDQGEITP